MRTGDRPRRGVRRTARPRADPAAPRRRARCSEALAATAAAPYAEGRAGGGGGRHPRAGRRAQHRHPRPAGRRRPGRRHHAVVTTAAGQRIGVGDRIATRRNDRDLGVANRDTWIVTAVGRDGELVVTPAARSRGTVTPAPGSVTPRRAVTQPGGQRVLPADYVTAHVELAYATTAHGVQGDTVTAAHVVVGEHTGAASAYVGMTRGRQANTAHLVAADVEPRRGSSGSRCSPATGPTSAPPTPPGSPPPRPPATPRPRPPARPPGGPRRAARGVDRRAALLSRLASPSRERDRLRQLVASTGSPHASELARPAGAGNGDRGRRRAGADRQLRGQRRGDRAADADRIRTALSPPGTVNATAASKAAQRCCCTGPAGSGCAAPRWPGPASSSPSGPTGGGPTCPPCPRRPGRSPGTPTGPMTDRRCGAAFDAAARRTAEQAHPEHAALRSAAATARTAHHASGAGPRAGPPRAGRDGRPLRPGGRHAGSGRGTGRRRPGARRRPHRPGRRPGSHRPPHQPSQPSAASRRSCSPGNATPGRPPATPTHRRQPRAAPRPPDPSSGLPHPYRHDPSRGPLRPRSGPGEMTSTRGSRHRGPVGAYWQTGETLARSSVTKRPEMAPSTRRGTIHTRPHREPAMPDPTPSRTRTAHHHRSRRLPARPRRHPPVLAASHIGPRSFRLGRRVLYRREDLHAWIDTNAGRIRGH